MKTIKINFENIQINYEALKKEWEKAKNAELVVEQLSDTQVNDMAKFLLAKKDSFAFDILFELMNNENLSNELCKEIFIHGDEACKAGICLRKNLSKELKQLCKQPR